VVVHIQGISGGMPAPALKIRPMLRRTVETAPHLVRGFLADGATSMLPKGPCVGFAGRFPRGSLGVFGSFAFTEAGRFGGESLGNSGSFNGGVPVSIFLNAVRSGAFQRFSLRPIG
jgi:hypothetical protein